ncbi:MAG: oligoendopeptidase F, partial [Oligoflexales bacterium]|nr:oligoendopeptidase F [Oligoflexales bacterium]
MNYQNKIDDVSTLGHELGHAMHSHLNMQANNKVYFGYSTFSAEIASTANEVFLDEYLLDKYRDNDDMRMYILGTRLESIRGTIFRQTLFTEFELEIHRAAERGIPITAELLNKTYLNLTKKYYGPGFTVDRDDEVEWAFIPHFYYKYYVFSYATGLSSGIAIAEKIKKDGVKARDSYLAMLKEPSTAQPVEILKKAGVDMTKPDAIESAIKMMDRTIDDIEAILARKKP